MKRLITILGILAMLTGCVQSAGMSNDAVIAEVKKCHDAGLGAWIQYGEDGSVWAVRCTTGGDHK